jgi:imidazole glycerol-phosphate synthase subunit HisH
MKVAILDYGIGNVRSVGNALTYLGIDSVLTNDPPTIMNADAAILPGVGAFKHGMENLRYCGLIPVINDFVATGKTFIGICLGMQMLMEQSEEFGLSSGLGLIKGNVIKLPLLNDTSYRLPHIGWNRIAEPESGQWSSTLLKGLNQENSFYFVHSYAAVPSSGNNILAHCQYGGIDFCASVKKDNIYGFQFHPEKSGQLGLRILNNLKNTIV